MLRVRYTTLDFDEDWVTATLVPPGRGDRVELDETWFVVKQLVWTPQGDEDLMVLVELDVTEDPPPVTVDLRELNPT